MLVKHKYSTETVYHFTTSTVLLATPFLINSFVYKPLQFFKDLGIPGPKPAPVIGNFGLFRKFDVSYIVVYP